MDSKFATLFLLLQARIQAQVPEIKHIDVEMSQLEAYEQRPAVAFPCVLIDFNNFEFKDNGDNSQAAEGEVNIRLAFAPRSNTSQSTPSLWKEKGLQYLELEWKLHRALHGWHPNDNAFGSFNRLGVATERRDDDLRVRNMRYGVAFEDDSTAYTEIMTAAGLELEYITSVPEGVGFWTVGVNFLVS